MGIKVTNELGDVMEVMDAEPDAYGFATVKWLSINSIDEVEAAAGQEFVGEVAQWPLVLLEVIQ